MYLLGGIYSRHGFWIAIAHPAPVSQRPSDGQKIEFGIEFCGSYVHKLQDRWVLKINESWIRVMFTRQWTSSWQWMMICQHLSISIFGPTWMDVLADEVPVEWRLRSRGLRTFSDCFPGKSHSTAHLHTFARMTTETKTRLFHEKCFSFNISVASLT